MIILSNTLSGIAYLLLALLVTTDLVELWMVVVWSVVTGALSALVAPAQLVDRFARAHGLLAHGVKGGAGSGLRLA